MHKKLSILIGLFFLTVPILAQGNINNAETMAEPPWISYVEGQVRLGMEKDEIINFPISENDILSTSEGRAEVPIGQGSYIWFNKNTEAEFTFIGENLVKVSLKSGNIYVRVWNKAVEINGIRIEEELIIEVQKGKTKKVNPLRVTDDFTRFVKNRKKEINREVENEYLPEELSEYEDELYYNGNWRYYRPCGYVWIPRVRVGWSPYFHGYWHDHSVFGRIWISLEGPWGWVVFHFGRWQWHSTWGWYWIPTRYWGPAWVYWYSYPSYYSWCPMWYGGWNSWYYQNYYSYHYRHNWNRGWTTIHKNQLASRNVAKHVISKTELKKRAPKVISSNQFRTSLSAATTGSISKSTARISPKSTMNRSQSLQNQTRQRIQSRQVRFKITNTYSSRTTTQKQNISKFKKSSTTSRIIGQTRTSPRIARTTKKVYSPYTLSRSRPSISSSRSLARSHSSRVIPRSNQGKKAVSGKTAKKKK